MAFTPHQFHLQKQKPTVLLKMNKTEEHRMVKKKEK